MKPFKTLLATVVITLAVFSLTFYSCQKHACKDVTCLNSGFCDNGICVCPTGYSGTKCEIFDKCATIVCLNGGVCTSGACKCPPAFEGERCETKTVVRWSGTWTVSENGTSSPFSQYYILVDPEPNTNALIIRNMRKGLIDSFSATIYAKDTLIIPLQNLGNVFVLGTAYMETSSASLQKVIMTYRVTYPNGDIDDFGFENGSPAVWTR